MDIISKNNIAIYRIYSSPSLFLVGFVFIIVPVRLIINSTSVVTSASLKRFNQFYSSNSRDQDSENSGPLQNDNSREQRSGNERLQCNKCMGFGHKARECPSRNVAMAVGH